MARLYPRRAPSRDHTCTGGVVAFTSSAPAISDTGRATRGRARMGESESPTTESRSENDHAALETWRAVYSALRCKGPPSMLEHADLFEQQSELHSPDQATAMLRLADGVFLRCDTWARWQPRIPSSAAG
jgi:hypothetical protein